MSVDRDIEDLVRENKKRIYEKYLSKGLPLEHFIYLKLLDAEALDGEVLFRLIRSAGYDVGSSQIMRALMKMEIYGLVEVENVGEGFYIKLVKEKRHLAVDEDRGAS